MLPDASQGRMHPNGSLIIAMSKEKPPYSSVVRFVQGWQNVSINCPHSTPLYCNAVDKKKIRNDKKVVSCLSLSNKQRLQSLTKDEIWLQFI